MTTADNIENQAIFKNYILIILDSVPNFQHFTNSVLYWLLLYIISWFVGIKWIISEINQPNERDVYLILILKQVLLVLEKYPLRNVKKTERPNTN